MLVRLTSSDFKDARLNRTGLIVVMFYADWCPFCMAFKPVFEDIARREDVDFGEANISHHDDPLWEQFQIKVIPSLLAFRDGELVKRKDGRLFRGLGKADLDELLSSIKSELGKS